MTDTRRQISPVKTIAVCSILASITAVMQLSAVFVPAFGHVLSAFCALPVAIATVVRPAGGIFTTTVAALIVMTVQPLEVPVLLFTSAPLGLVLGSGLVTGRQRWLTVAAGAIVFFAGTALLTYTAGQVVSGGPFGASALYRMLAFNALFSLLYAGAWEVFVRKIVTRLSLFFPYLRH
ncbi:MAG: hypothetical protein ACOY4Q_03115 [Bacillota bacterium]